MLVNVKKICCVVFNTKDKHKTVSQTLKKFVLNENEPQFVFTFKYLRYVLSCDYKDDADVNREARNL